MYVGFFLAAGASLPPRHSQGQHGVILEVVRATVRNFCWCCGLVLSSTAYAKLHIHKSLKNGFCRGIGSLSIAEKFPIDLQACPVCTCDFSEFDDDMVSKHMLLHFPRELALQNPVWQEFLFVSPSDSDGQP